VILEVDPASAVPPYEQVRAQLASMITAGSLPPGTRLPTIRALAGDLGVPVEEALAAVGKAFGHRHE
jgi:DNA-binding transcriptional regulator YhcF (GntR family)